MAKQTPLLLEETDATMQRPHWEPYITSPSIHQSAVELKKIWLAYFVMLQLLAWCEWASAQGLVLGNLVHAPDGPHTPLQTLVCSLKCLATKYLREHVSQRGKRTEQQDHQLAPMTKMLIVRYNMSLLLLKLETQEMTAFASFITICSSVRHGECLPCSFSIDLIVDNVRSRRVWIRHT